MNPVASMLNKLDSRGLDWVLARDLKMQLDEFVLVKAVIGAKDVGVELEKIIIIEQDEVVGILLLEILALLRHPLCSQTRRHCWLFGGFGLFVRWAVPSSILTWMGLEEIRVFMVCGPRFSHERKENKKRGDGCTCLNMVGASGDLSSMVYLGRQWFDVHTRKTGSYVRRATAVAMPVLAFSGHVLVDIEPRAGPGNVFG